VKEPFSGNRRFVHYCLNGASSVTPDFLVYSVLLKAGTLYVLVARLVLDKYVSKLATLAIVVILQYNLNRLISFRKSPAAKS